MKVITFYESDSRLEKIDSLVKAGAFSSREEVYRAGAWLLTGKKELQKLAKLYKLDSEIFGKEIRECLESLVQGKPNIALEKLKDIVDSLKLRAMISPLLGDDKESFQTVADGMRKYADLVLQFDQFDKDTKGRIIKDLKRDLSAIAYYLEQAEKDEIQLFDVGELGKFARLHYYVYESGGFQEFLERHIQQPLPESISVIAKPQSTRLSENIVFVRKRPALKGDILRLG